jgi:hypothetical protein
MFKRNLAVTFTAVLLSTAGAVQAAASSYPSGAEEGSGYSVNAPVNTTGNSLSGADSVFPSVAHEGSESNGRYAAYATPRNLENSFAGGHGGVFPGSAMD